MLQGNSQRTNADGKRKVVFKKYGKNRRLYDTSSSRYVNLDEVAALIRNGTEVQVVDAQTGEDLTRGCLDADRHGRCQRETNGASAGIASPTGRCLRSCRARVHHVVFESAFDTYKKVQGAMENGLTGVHSAATSPLQTLRSFIQGTATEKESQASELQELRKRIAELEARSAEPAKRASSKRRTPKAPAGH